MSFTGLQQWVAQQGGALLFIGIVILVVMAFIRRDFKELVMTALFGGFAWLLIAQGPMVMRAIGSIFQKIFG
ncbi:hypothetical protein D3P96_03665 [Weissella viridescens]|uniref:Uncharacterized protein n=1 Tax=Weissella viridescens TaxID=1629 RepID=A0A3P2RCP3_WEIVI|nr:TcpD family membrane protein [Weissella viridescens]RRG18393.1 hypothetical protein D3P96_03665 [Weissella viridescens]